MLQVGLVVRYGSKLWRVDMINQSRAYLVPVRRTEVKKTEEEVERGVSISSDSPLEIVADVELACIELEEQKLATKRRLLNQARRELEEIANEEQQLAIEVAAVQAAKRQLQGNPVGSPTIGRGARTGGGWHLTPTILPNLTTGSQGADVVEYIGTHPGCTEADVAGQFPQMKNVPQCLSRLKLTGRIEKR